MKNNDEKGEEKTGLSMLDMLKESPTYEIDTDRLNEEEQNPESDPFQGFAFSDNADLPEAPPPPDDTPGRPEPGKVNEANAKMAVGILDMITSKAASAFSGQPSANYKMSSEDKEDYVTLTAEYFATLQNSVSPALMWWSATLAITSATLYKANEDKKGAEKAEAHKRAKLQYQALQRSAEASADQLASTYEDLKNSKPEGPQRQRFETDADGLFVHNENGVYLKKKERDEHPAPDLRVIIKECEELKMSPGEINRRCREYLYGEIN